MRGYSSNKYFIVQPGVGNPWIAAVIASEKIEIFHLSNYDSPHVTCFQIIKNGRFLYNKYLLSIFITIRAHLERVRIRIILGLNTNRYIVTMDSNAKSELWFAEETDDRGNVTEEFLATHGLYVLNEADNLPTFQTINGQSNIDLTLVNGSMIGSCTGWLVSPKCSTSDHNLILFNVFTGGRYRKFIKYDLFNVRKTNWERFCDLIERDFSDEIVYSLSNKKPDKTVRKFNCILERICQKSIPEKKRCNIKLSLGGMRIWLSYGVS